MFTIKLVRFDSYSYGTFGRLYVPVGDSFVTFQTLEPSKPIINPGTYTLTYTYSVKFGRKLPLINNVVGHSGVRIHSGNTVSDTIGCILIGSDREKNHLISSRIALKKFLSLVTFPCNLEVFSTHEGGLPPEN